MSEFDLSVFPWEDKELLIAEAEAIIERCFNFDGDFRGVTGRLDQEPGYDEGTQP